MRCLYLARVAFATPALAATLVLAPRALPAQGEVVGLVLEDSSRRPIPDATLTIAALNRNVRSDSLGRFMLAGIPRGDHVLQVRALGFREARHEVTIASNEVIVTDVLLTRTAQVLAGTNVMAPAAATGKMAGFMERKQRGTGHFIMPEQLRDAEGRRKTGDLLSLVPGAVMKRGGMKAWIASGRATNQMSGGCAFCKDTTRQPDRADRAAGAPKACYMDVYLDGTLVFDSSRPSSGLFDVNSLDPAHLEGVEVYASASQVPAQYNRTAGGCGVILLWTR